MEKNPEWAKHVNQDILETKVNWFRVQDLFQMWDQVLWLQKWKEREVYMTMLNLLLKVNIHMLQKANYFMEEDQEQVVLKDHKQAKNCIWQINLVEKQRLILKLEVD